MLHLLLMISLYIVAAASDSSTFHSRELAFTEFDILSKFYNATGGANWDSNSNWLIGAPCPSGAWHGVTCFGDDVVKVTLTGNNLVGSLPSQFGLLSKMTGTLLLDANELGETIPSELGMLTGITVFDGYNNQFTGFIPSQLGLMTLLTRLPLNGNKLRGTIPSQLGQLTLIDNYFNIATNYITGSIPSEIGLLSDVWRLYAYSNNLCDDIPSQVSALSSVVSLVISSNSLGTSCTVLNVLSSLYTSASGASWTNKLNWMGDNWPCPSGAWYGVTCSGNDVVTVALTGNNLVGSLPSQLGLLSNMTGSLLVDANELGETIPSELGMLTGLIVFDGYNNQFTGFMPSQLGLMTVLTRLPVNGNNLRGTIPSQLGQLTLIDNYFNIATNYITGSIPSELGLLSDVWKLYAYSNNLCDDIPSQVSALSSVVNLVISSNSLGTSCTLHNVLSSLYTSASGASWTNKLNWMGDDWPCPSGAWYGVTCSGDDVVGLNMTSNGLDGTLPSEIGLLSKIEHLDVSSCDVSGSIPSEVGMLSTVSHFNFYSNYLSGTLPSEMGTMTLNRLMNFAANSLSGSIPFEVSQLSFTESIYLNSNQFTGSIPSQLGGLTLVDNLDFTSNFLTGSLPSQLGMIRMQDGWFSLSYNNFTGSIPTELGLFSQAISFDLTINNLCGNVPVEVSSLSSIVSSMSIVHGNSLGTSCCVLNPAFCTDAPTQLPTTLPTSSPSLAPSPSPSSTPTLAPTPLPTVPPTSNPSLTPTLIPIPSPTLPPTPLPSPVPSSPSPVPTPVPTVNCIPGEYFDGIVCGTCSAGQYSDFDTAPYPPSCTLCSSGQYQSQTGSTECVVCDTGKLSAPDRSFCKDCSYGEYVFNDTSCESCQLGRYAPQALSGACLVCAAGSHTNSESSATTCSSCDAGKYSNRSSYLCTDCERGTYSSFGAASCTACAEGYVSPQNGSSSCTACSAGFFAPSALNCTACLRGRYQGSTAQSSCVECEEGKYAPNEESTSCIACSAGTSSALAASLACTVCPLGTYQGSTGQTNCVDCEEGKFASTNTSTSCSSCDAGKYSNISASQCSHCESGKYSSSSVARCTVCAKGFYAPTIGSSTCIACSSGKVAPNASSSNCTSCSIGTYQGSTGQASCDACEEGKYAISKESTSCSSCDAGKYSSSLTGFADCLNCGRGKFSSSSASSCDVCVEGFYASSFGSSSCTACSSGRFTSNSSAWNCTACAVGTFQGSTGQSSCDACEEGKYAIIEESTSCSSCDAGKYSSSLTGFADCLNCGRGKFSSSSASSCDVCVKGFYASSFGSSSCTACSSGRFTSNSSAWNCTVCAVGTFQGSTGQSSCDACEEGKYATSEESTSCSSCDAGKYSSSLTGFADCLNCGRGKFSSSSASSCVDCVKGFYASSFGSSSCTACSSGRFTSNSSAWNCTVCAVGTFQGSTGQSSCDACEEGKYATSEESTSCSNCDAGKYSSSLTGFAECKECAKGRKSSSGAANCDDCAKGFFAPTNGLSTCVACSAGTIAVNTSSINCTACLKGTYQGSTGQSECSACEIGKYGNEIGLSSCVFCDTGYSSVGGSSVCASAVSNTYLDSSGISVDCPSRATCLGGFFAPLPDAGFWVDHSSYEYAGEMYECSRSTCLGGVLTTSTSTSRRRLGTGVNVSACWHRHQFNKSVCNDDTLQCDEGAGGVLCGSCVDGYLYNGVTNSCSQCGNAMESVRTVGVMLVILILLLFVITRTNIIATISSTKLAQALSVIDTGSLKILWVTYQIISSVTFNLDVEFPSPFSAMQNWLTFFAFDFVPLSCLEKGENRYFYTVYVWVAFPLLIAALIVLVIIPRYCCFPKQKDKFINEHTYWFLLWSYLVLPPVSNKQFQSFDCISLKSGAKYLRVDTSVNCTSDSYQQFQIVIGISIIIYQFVPIMWWVLLYRNRRELNPATSGDIQNALFIRNGTASLQPLKFLFTDYRCSMYWFEIVDMYRRMLFIGVLPLVSTKDPIRASFGVILSILSLVFIREKQPYVVEVNNMIAHVAQISILVTFYSALSIATNSIMFKGFILGVFIFSVNSLILLFSLYFGFVKFRKLRKLQTDKENKANWTEDATGFSEGKFKTTFEALWANDVPSAHSIVFYYTTKLLAIRARKTGIPVHKKYGGVPLTLRQPHHITKNDMNVFSTMDYDLTHEIDKKKLKFPNEEVILLSLPRKFLDPLPGYEDDPSMCMISEQHLSALRPDVFSSLLDQRLWQDNFLFLPPQSILRCFYIQKGLTNDENVLRSSMKLTDVNHDDDTLMKKNVIIDRDLFSVEIKVLDSVLNFKEPMDQIRKYCNKRSVALVPLYHYTSTRSAKLILKGGFRMSTQGQGDGGVYVSTQGPASYKLGTDSYETNIIKDCFGVERLEEYKGKGFLEVVLVYGCTASVLEQTPGGRENAKTFSKSTFEALSLPHNDGYYFLRPDRILGAFHVKPGVILATDRNSQNQLNEEIQEDKDSVELLKQAEADNNDNIERITNSLQSLWPSTPLQTKASLIIPDEDDEEAGARPTRAEAEHVSYPAAVAVEVGYGAATEPDSSPLLNTPVITRPKTTRRPTSAVELAAMKKAIGSPLGTPLGTPLGSAVGTSMDNGPVETV